MSGERPGCSIDSQGEASDRDTAEDGSSVVTVKPYQPDPKTIVSQKLEISETMVSGLPLASFHPRC